MIKQRLPYFDQMKGIAILFVIIGHLMLFSFQVRDTSLEWFLCIFEMPIFFYISGYFAYREIHSVKDVVIRLWKRFHSLLFPYFIFASLYCIFKGKDYIKMLSCGGEEYWFLYVLFLLSSFFTIYEFFVGRLRNTIAYVLMWLLPYVLLCYIRYKYGEIGGGKFAIYLLVSYYRYFLLGYFCRKFERLNSFFFRNKYVYAIGFLLFLYRWYYSGHTNIIVTFGGVLGSIVILQTFLEDYVGKGNKCLTFLSKIGEESLVIYVTQYFFLPDLKNIFQPLIDIPNGFLFQLLVCLFFAVPIACAGVFIGAIIKKNQFLRWTFLGKNFT